MNRQHKQHPQVLELKIKGTTTGVTIPALKTAHGLGLDGATPVFSLEFGEAPRFPGKIFVRDTNGNAIMTTPDELFVLTRLVARGYRVAATRKPKHQ